MITSKINGYDLLTSMNAYQTPQLKAGAKPTRKVSFEEACGLAAGMDTANFVGKETFTLTGQLVSVKPQ